MLKIYFSDGLEIDCNTTDLETSARVIDFLLEEDNFLEMEGFTLANETGEITEELESYIDDNLSLLPNIEKNFSPTVKEAMGK